jgi:hypothetical protein
MFVEERIDASRWSRSDGDDADGVSVCLEIASEFCAAAFGAAGEEFGDEQIDFHLAAG